MFKKTADIKTVRVDEKLKHIAFIMDGNGRWAKNKGLPREAGHKYGALKFQEVIKYCSEIGLKAVTVYAFSTENWKRPENEVKALMNLFVLARDSANAIVTTTVIPIITPNSIK